MRLRVWVAMGLALVAVGARGQAGPPFQTDDPTPVDYGHYEAYVFGVVDATPIALGSAGPAFEFNWGAIPRVQLHMILPFGTSAPMNDPVYAAAGLGQGDVTFGLTDMEVGAKIAWVTQTKKRPQIGTFTMFELPTGNADRGLGVGKTWYKLPVWVEKEIGDWSLVGGMGYTVIPQPDAKNFLYGGFLVKRKLSERLELAAEVFAHAGEGEAAAQNEASTMVDFGGYYHFKAEGWQLLGAYGHSVAGQTENYAYLGLYKTWGKDKGKPAEKADAAAGMRSQRPAF
ncbi:MAG: transporter [Acidobacteriota bacterium]